MDGKDRSKMMSQLVTALVCFGTFLALGLVAKPAIGIWIKRSASADAENGADQNVEWIIAERAAVSAHIDAVAADFVMAGRIEQA
jgi:hypothetical protein